MTMSVNDENSAGAANNNNCTKAELEHYDGGPGSDLGRSLWHPCPMPPQSGGRGWLSNNSHGGVGGPGSNGPDGPDDPTYTPLVKVEPPAAMGGGGQQPQTSLTITASSHHPSNLNGGPGGNNGGSISTECSGCGDLITDRFILQVAGRSWHGQCLRCIVCHSLLDGHASCFLRDEQLYCKLDYTKLFGAKCYKCERMISPADWVRKAREQVYHLACFACDSCKRQLSTGEEFGISENRVLCKVHYMETIDGGCTSSDDNGDSESHTKKKTKRMRTTFTEEQVQILQANFQIDSNPDGQDLERIAQITGLSKRVTQVWFQNCRARQKKYINSGKRSGSGGNSKLGSNCNNKKNTMYDFDHYGDKSIPINGLSPVPRDQCAGNGGGPGSGPNPGAVDMHAMYSSFRGAAAAAAAVAAAASAAVGVNGPPTISSPVAGPPPPPPLSEGSNDTSDGTYTTLSEV